MNWKELQYLDEQFLMQSSHRYPIGLSHGEGSQLYDLHEQEYLDFSSTMGSGCIGQGNSRWTEAVMDQMLQLGHASPLFYTQPEVELAEALCMNSGMTSACFTSSGSEANRLMHHLARSYSRSRYHEQRSQILSLQTNSSTFHAEDVNPVSASIEEIRDMVTCDVCAITLELLPASGSMNPLPRPFVHELAILCAEQDWLLLIDERQSCAGRCGSLFAFMQYGIRPDLVTFSSAISGGLPLGGVLSSNRCRATLTPQLHREFSLGVNPLCAAAALSVLDLLNEDRLAQAKEKGDYFRSGMQSLQLPMLGEPGGIGLMIGVGIKEGCPPLHLAANLANNGLLCLSTEDGLLFLPPLTVTNQELDRALEILQHSLHEGE